MKPSMLHVISDLLERRQTKARRKRWSMRATILADTPMAHRITSLRKAHQSSRRHVSGSAEVALRTWLKVRENITRDRRKHFRECVEDLKTTNYILLGPAKHGRARHSLSILSRSRPAARQATTHWQRATQFCLPVSSRLAAIFFRTGPEPQGSISKPHERPATHRLDGRGDLGADAVAREERRGDRLRRQRAQACDGGGGGGGGGAATWRAAALPQAPRGGRGERHGGAAFKFKAKFPAVFEPIRKRHVARRRSPDYFRFSFWGAAPFADMSRT